MRVLLIFCSFFSLSFAHASTLDVFGNENCAPCEEEARLLPEIQNKFPDLQIRFWNIETPEGQEALRSLDISISTDSPDLPVNVLNSTEVLAGFDQYALFCALGDETMCLTKQYSSWVDLSWPFMAFVLGAIDGFNPCAMWSLLMLLGFLIPMENWRHRWLIGGIFVGSSAILYGAALFGFLFAFEGLLSFLKSGASSFFFRLIGVISIGAGIFSLYAFWKNKVECEIRNPSDRKRFHQKLQQILQKEHLFLLLPGVILLAFSVNSVELLCSLGIPTVFTAQILSLPFSEQIAAILIYDVAYVLDDLVVFLIAMTTLSLRVASPMFVRISHLLAGIVLLLMGGILLFQSSLLFFSF